MIAILRADITSLPADAIVNAANSALAGGGGVDGAIHATAGPELAVELLKYSGCPTGSAVITRGHRLPARFVIHAVGPVWRGGKEREAELLASAYETSFRLAREEGSIRTIAFPAISTGVYGFPKPSAAEIALGVMLAHEPEFERITACLFDEESAELYRETLARLKRTRNEDRGILFNEDQ
jgi:O-acetyl-ADP-ribose deacetylase (regulator of RNase III)